MKLKNPWADPTPEELTRQHLAEAEAALLKTHITREAAQAEALRATADISILNRRIARLRKLTGVAPTADVVVMKKRGAA